MGVEVEAGVSGNLGAGHPGRDSIAVRDGRIKGDGIRFTMDHDPAGKASPVEFTGRIRGNTIEGTIPAEQSRQPGKPPAIPPPYRGSRSDRGK